MASSYGRVSRGQPFPGARGENPAGDFTPAN